MKFCRTLGRLQKRIKSDELQIGWEIGKRCSGASGLWADMEQQCENRRWNGR